MADFKLIRNTNAYIGASTDTKPSSDTLIGSKAYEHDTGNWYVTYNDGSNWVLLNDDAETVEVSSIVLPTGSSSLLQGNITLDGSAQQLNADTTCKSVTIESHPDNVDYVYVGNASVSSTVHMFVLQPGGSVTLAANNLNLLYVRGTNTELVSYGGEV